MINHPNRSKVWTAEVVENTIRIFRGGHHLSTACHAVSYRSGDAQHGWKILPLSPNHSPSRRVWDDPISAAKSLYGKNAAAAVATAFAKLVTPSEG